MGSHHARESDERIHSIFHGGHAKRYKKDSLLTVADMVWVYSWNFSLQLSLVFVS